MPVFLTQSQLYRLIQRELPEDVYPHSGDPSVYLSTADSASQAEMIANVYEALQQAYDNQWPQHANEDGIAMHEVARFGKISTGLSLSDRRLRVLAKMRALPSMSDPDLTALVQGFLPTDATTNASAGVLAALAANGETQETMPVHVVLYAYNALGNTWRLGLSELGVDTILGGGMRAPAGVDVCDLAAADLGLTEDEMQDARLNAYFYEVRIYDGDTDTVVDAQTLATIEEELLGSEPARSQHLIRSGLVSTLAVMDRRDSTTLHLVADDWADTDDGTWYDRSDAGNHATIYGTIGDFTLSASQQFADRSALFADFGFGFHAPGDDLNASTKRTYEVVLDDLGLQTDLYILARKNTSGSQYLYALMKHTAGAKQCSFEADVYNSAASNPWAGSTRYDATKKLWSLPVLMTVVFDMPNRTVKIYQNGELLTQHDNPLSGSLATPTSQRLGIFGRYNEATGQIDNSGCFDGGILEILRHDEALDADTVAARAAEFNRLKGY